MPPSDHIFALRQDLKKLQEEQQTLKLQHAKLKSDIAEGLDHFVQILRATEKKERRKR